MNDIPPWFVAFIFAVVLGVRLATKRWSISLLFGCILLILGETLLFRKVTGTMQTELVPFWSYKKWRVYGPQIIANVLLFIPFGVVGTSIWKWKSVFFATGLSCIIELIQLISRRGLFEFDDIIHNTIGAVIGCLLYMFIHKRKGIT